MAIYNEKINQGYTEKHKNNDFIVTKKHGEKTN